MEERSWERGGWGGGRGGHRGLRGCTQGDQELHSPGRVGGCRGGPGVPAQISPQYPEVPSQAPGQDADREGCWSGGQHSALDLVQALLRAISAMPGAPPQASVSEFDRFGAG